MTTLPDPDSFLTYVSGVSDAAETEAVEAWLAAGSPAAAAHHAEAVAVYNAIALGLSPVEPPDAVRQAVLGRVAADVSGGGAGTYAAGRTLRWPGYVSSGVAACLLVGLSVTLWRYNELSNRADGLATNLTQLQSQQNQQPPMQAGMRQLMSSPHLSLASLTTAPPDAAPPPAKPDPAPGTPAGRVLYCPVTKFYQVTVFGLPSLPADRAYELWLITPEGHKIPSGLFKRDGQGMDTLMTHPDNVAIAVRAAVTDEPASGSLVPTGKIHLTGTLQQQQLQPR